MNSELPDLEPSDPTGDLAARQAGQFSVVLLTLGILVPLLLLYLSTSTGRHLWLTLLNLVCVYSGLAVAALGWRRERRDLVKVGTTAMVVACVASLVTLSLLS
ncbi:hypothetical protein H181DRAFT_02368 [Streptomyces sp. WMMB 714]|uniref:hypothetical protein n=1 Tax=Streptomyces sp. WMMB 714 TaxID=1286822 RepID=UPI0005F88A05|nr:hypothetical protein [Streptomyces sp. WMMB 714]SCK29915.1 hypothetical protein H181DRAFT_02368 [Streptomyces sp. WMMB 714]